MTPGRVLIVDDREDNLYLLSALLQGHGYTVATAANGAEALDAAQKEPPDLIITDILMPVMDGFTLCRAWKRDEALKPIPFIFYTATYTERRDKEFALSLGAERFLVKPVEPEILLETVRETLAETRDGGGAGRERSTAAVAQSLAGGAAAVAPAAETSEQPPPTDEEPEYLRQYSEVLVRKLEAKMQQLEVANRELERANSELEGVNRELEQDIAARREVEEVLRATEDRYRSYVDHAPYAVFVVDAEGRCLEVNPAAEGLTGYSPDELMGLRLPELVDPELQEWAQLRIAELRQHGSMGGSGAFTRADGEVFHGRVDAVRLSPTRYLVFVVDISEQKAAEAATAAAAHRLELMLKAAVAALSATTELRDPYTAGHQRRVSELAVAIATELGWDEASIDDLMTASLLHDIGKIVVPAEILTRPGRLGPVEMQLVRQHSAAGADTVAEIDVSGAIAAAVRQHHERLDGSGYPDGLRDAEILPAARVLAVADVFEAMVSHRPYRAARPEHEAIAEIRDGLGTRYDAEIGAVCLRLLEEEGFVFTNGDGQG